MSSAPKPRKKLVITYQDETGAMVTKEFTDDKYHWSWGEKTGILFVVSLDERTEQGFSSKFPFRFSIEKLDQSVEP